jgi:hypothetical protein
VISFYNFDQECIGFMSADIPINGCVFLNGEIARIYFSKEHSYGGLFASVTNGSSPGNYQINYDSGNRNTGNCIPASSNL